MHQRYTSKEEIPTNEDDVENEDDEANDTTTRAILPWVGFDVHWSCHGERGQGQLKDHVKEALMHLDGLMRDFLTWVRRDLRITKSKWDREEVEDISESRIQATGFLGRSLACQCGTTSLCLWAEQSGMSCDSFSATKLCTNADCTTCKAHPFSEYGVLRCEFVPLRVTSLLWICKTCTLQPQL